MHSRLVLLHLADGWAARLHETGLDIAHSKYQRHSAYLLQNADMPGFPREEQQLLSALPVYQRGPSRCCAGTGVT